jgi:hypothetical protein
MPAGIIHVPDEPTVGITATSQGVHLLPERARGAIYWRDELPWVATLAAVIIIGVFPLIAGGITAGIDTLTFFYPMFSFLGEQLRSGNIPGWTPAQFSGMPFAADPESGWTYLPAMLFFTLLPVVAAAKTLLLFHALLAALSMYGLARTLAMPRISAFVAGSSYALSYFFYTRSICCPAHIFVLAWLPTILLFIRLASNARTWPIRVWCWAVAGLALSQTIAGWIGQGSYYAVLLTAGFVAYLELLQPRHAAWPLGRRLGRMAVSLGAVLAWAAGFAAAGVLPRVEFVNASNLAGGYQGPSATQGGFSLQDVFSYLLIFDGVAVILLAIAAPFLARRRFLTPFFAIIAVLAVILSLRDATPLHLAAYALFPRFGELHQHSPERVLLVFYPAAAILAGATTAWFQRWSRLSFAMVGVVLANLLLVNWWFAPAGSRHLDLDAYYSPAGVAAFLRNQGEGGEFRFAGYDPAFITLRYGLEVRYIWQMFEPGATSLLVNNRATLLGLQDIQGYNPLQLQRYVEFFDALNGEAQEYHGRYVLPGGLDSPLLDLLNARYIVIPAEFASDRTDLQGLVEKHPIVYRDDLVQIVENRDAFPRAWIVHEAQQVERGAALDLLASGSVDARTTALLEVAPPPLTPANDPSKDLVLVERYEPDAIRLRTSSDALGLLVLSEMYYSAWNAYVDGAPTTVSVADHTLRAVALPAGEHVVELRYESTALRIGLVISLATYGAFGMLGMLIVWRRLVSGRRGHGVGRAAGPVPGATFPGHDA